MQKKKQLSECWKYLVKTIKNKNTFEIGFLHKICNILLDDDYLTDSGLNPNGDNFNKANNYNNSSSSSFQNDFTTFVVDFLTVPPEKGRKTQQLNSEYLRLIIIDSIIFNLYARSRHMDKLRLNNSFYNNSMSMMSMSQMSDQLSEQVSVINNQQDLKLALAYVQNLSSSNLFFKKLKVLYDRAQNKSKNHHYLENLLQTIEYVLNKQKSVVKQNFIQQKDQYFKTFLHAPNTHFTLSNSLQSIQKVNTVIFSNQLNKIVYLLTNANEQVFYSLNRIYFVGKKSDDRKHFRNVKYPGGDMIFNLNKTYVQSFNNKMEIFQESKNPLFMLIKSYLPCFFLPTFKRFNQIILEMAKTQYNGSMISFYKANEQAIQKNLLAFVQQLPIELVEYLHILYRTIQKQLTGKRSSVIGSSVVNSRQTITPSQVSNSVSSLVPIKRFLIYSFLVDPLLIKQYIFPSSSGTQSSTSTATVDSSNNGIQPQKYEQVCNFIINLFFSSSVKKYKTNQTIQQLYTLTRLSQLIQNRLQEKILSYDPIEIYYDINDQNTETILNSYFIQQPLLNHDYEILNNRLKQVQFTPKDLKIFQIRKQSQLYDIRHATVTEDAESSRQLQTSNNPYTSSKYNSNINNNNQPSFTNKNRLKDFQYTSEQLINKEQSPVRSDLMMMNEKPYESEQVYERDQNYQLLNQQFNSENKDEQVDFLTWMTVGGNHNYKEKLLSTRTRSKFGSKTLNHHYSLQSHVQQSQEKNITNMNFFNKDDKLSKNTSLLIGTGSIQVPISLIPASQLKLTDGNSNNNNNNTIINLANTMNLTNTINIQQDQGQKNYSKRQFPKKRLKQFVSYDRQKVRQINLLYEEYNSKNIFY